MEAPGFKPHNRTGLRVDLDSASQVDVRLDLAEKVDEVLVNRERAALGDGQYANGRSRGRKAMTPVALNGRSFTDLLAL
jgi:hypothetical protein